MTRRTLSAPGTRLPLTRVPDGSVPVHRTHTPASRLRRFRGREKRRVVRPRLELFSDCDVDAFQADLSQAGRVLAR